MMKKLNLKQGDAKLILIVFISLSILVYLVDASFKISDMYLNMDYRKISSPLFLKWIRDLVFIFLLVTIYLKVSEKMHIFLNLALGFVLYLMIYQNPIIQNLAGLKVIVPLLIFITPIKFNNYFEIDDKSVHIFKAVLVFHLLLQMINCFSGKGLHGVYAQGFSARSVGLEPAPGVTAFLSICLFHLINSTSKKFNKCFFTLTIISVGLSSSLMGLILITLIHLIYFSKKRKLNFLANSFLLVFFWLFMHLSRITGFEIINININSGEEFEFVKSASSITYIKNSGGTRIEMLSKALEKLLHSNWSDYQLLNFGLNTSWGYGKRVGVMGESLYTAMLQNTNLIFITLFIILFIYFAYTSRKYLFTGKDVCVNTLIVVLSSFTLITTELLFTMLILYISRIIIVNKIYSHQNPAQA